MHDACDALTALARRVGAVNTFWLDDAGQLIGDNTDVGGFTAAAAAVYGGPLRDISVGVYGAGGAAAAVLAAVEGWEGCTAHVFNRTPERAKLLCERFGDFAQPVDDMAVILGADLLVNATSIGLHGNDLPIALELIPAGRAVLDLVYRRGQTPWIRALRARRFRAADGITMLIEQGALAFERWFDIAPDRAVMWNALEEPPALS
jgi:shikimate dehydrogenase